MGVKNQNTDSEENEEFLIALTDAVINPRTVMVHPLNTSLTHTAAITHNTTLNNLLCHSVKLRRVELLM